MAQKTAESGTVTRGNAVRVLAVALAAGLAAAPAMAQNFPVTDQQRGTAQQVAQTGVPLSDLAEGAPDDYTVKRGDTLWAISGLFLKSPWRWPELWGMNLQDIANPHRIYPGQQLHLERANGRALLRLRAGEGMTADAPTQTIRVSPGTRVQALPDAALPALRPQIIEAFLNEAVIVEAGALERAPRIVAAGEGRVLLTRGDRAYARGPAGTPLGRGQAPGDNYRVFRDARPLKDPVSGAVLGYEAQYLGKAALMRDESTTQAGTDAAAVVVPATIDIVAAKEEMRVGDRLLPEPERSFPSYVPHAPGRTVQGTIVSVYGDAVSMAGQNQVVVIDKGAADGIETGHVMAIQKDGARMLDRSSGGERAAMKLPDERNGLLMVFRTFDKLSYALILEITDSVKIGDRVSNPR